MKIDRLIGIVMLLLQKEKITTSDLAKRFEVSGRTINRDVDDLCKAGIPIISIQGYGGGLSIASGYKLDKTVLTEKELQAIFMGLKSIDSVSKTDYSQGLRAKLFNEKNSVFAEQNTILIDLASWYQDSLSDKIDNIKNAILNQEMISFSYYANKGDTERIVEPYLIIFKWTAWYVYGYCQNQKDYRLFKLNRLWNLQNTGEIFESQNIQIEKLDFDRYFQTDEIRLVAIFDMNAKYRLIEEYGIDSFEITDSGELYFQRYFVDFNYLFQWVLSFGDKVKVIEPVELRTEICKNAKNILNKYK